MSGATAAMSGATAATMTGSSEPPLRGLRVLDLSRLVAGNQLTVLLGDFGADVMKVEHPKTGDTLRDWRAENV